MWAAQLHGHSLDLGVSVGSLGLRVALLGTVIVVAGHALLQPFLARQLAVNVRVVTVTAGVGVLLALLLSTGTTVPRQLVVVLTAAAAVPIYAAYGNPLPVVRQAAPVVLALAGAGATAMFVLSVLEGAGQTTVSVLYDGLLLALVGLSWLMLCQPRSRRTAVLAAAGGWLLATATVGGAGHVAMLALAGG